MCTGTSGNDLIFTRVRIADSMDAVVCNGNVGCSFFGIWFRISGSVDQHVWGNGKSNCSAICRSSIQHVYQHYMNAILYRLRVGEHNQNIQSRNVSVSFQRSFYYSQEILLQFFYRCGETGDISESFSVTKELQKDSINLFLGNFVPYKEKESLWELESDFHLHNKEIKPGLLSLFVITLMRSLKNTSYWATLNGGKCHLQSSQIALRRERLKRSQQHMENFSSQSFINRIKSLLLMHSLNCNSTTLT